MATSDESASSIDTGRRALGTALLGALGASLLSACKEDDPIRADRGAVDVLEQELTTPTSARSLDATTLLASTAGSCDGELMFTLGYAAAGDGGAALWRFKAGVTAGANQLTRYNASNGQWEIVLVGDVVNVRQMGVMPDGSDCAPRITALITLLSGPHVGTDFPRDRRHIKLYFPAKLTDQRSYHIASPIIPPRRADDQQKLVIVGDGCVGRSQAPYGNVDGEHTFANFFGGSSIQAAPGVAVIDMAANDGSMSVVEIRDIGLQTSGDGICIDMGGVPGVSDNGVNACELENVTTVGGEVGWRMYSYLPTTSRNVRMYGHKKHLEVMGAGAQTIFGLECQGGQNAITLVSSLSLNLETGIIQGISGSCVDIPEYPQYGGNRYVILRGFHCETYAKVLTEHPNNVGRASVISMDHCRFAGTPAQNAVVPYGSGWSFIHCAKDLQVTEHGPISYIGQRPQSFVSPATGASRLVLDPQGSVASVGLAGSAVPSDVVIGVERNLSWSISAAGAHIQHLLSVPKTNLLPPTDASHGDIFVAFFSQDGTGGRELQLPGWGLGGVFGEAAIDNSGNTPGAVATLVGYRNGYGGSNGQQTHVLSWSGWSGARKLATSTVTLPDISAPSAVVVPVPATGKLLKVLSALGGTITGADASIAVALRRKNEATFTAVGGAAWTVAYAGSNAGDSDEVSPTEVVVVAQGDVLRVSSDGASTGAVPLTVTFVVGTG